MGQPGLRERKKQKARQAIFDATLRLFLDKGFDATTVEQIAEAAEIAPRTFFRYFPTKEDVLFLGQDLEDRAVVEALKQRGSRETQVEALQRACAAMPPPADSRGDLHQLVRLIVATPALLARAVQVLSKSHQRLAAGLAGPKATAEERRHAHMLVGAYIGAFVAAMVSQLEARADIDLRAIADEVGTKLKGGFSDVPSRRSPSVRKRSGTRRRRVPPSGSTSKS